MRFSSARTISVCCSSKVKQNDMLKRHRHTGFSKNRSTCVILTNDPIKLEITLLKAYDRRTMKQQKSPTLIDDGKRVLASFRRKRPLQIAVNNITLSHCAIVVNTQQNRISVSLSEARAQSCLSVSKWQFWYDRRLDNVELTSII